MDKQKEICESCKKIISCKHRELIHADNCLVNNCDLYQKCSDVNQKEIEEMAKVKCKHFIEEICSKLDCKKDCKYYGKANCKTCIHEDICQLRIINCCEEDVKEKGCEHYQPKIDKDSVVLSREELNKKYISVEMYELAKAFHDEKCAEFEKLCYDYHRLQDTINEKIASDIADYIAKERRETTEKIINDILEFLKVCPNIITSSYTTYYEKVPLREYLIELAKKTIWC